MSGLSTVGNVVAIKKYFDNVTMAELKALSSNDRKELGELAKAELAKAK